MGRPEKLFHLWYIEPLRALESEIGADAGFIAISIGCFLYERYATATLKQQPAASARREDKMRQLALDFEIGEEAAEYFWSIIRDGLLHGGMPKQRDRSQHLPRWVFSQSFDQPIALASLEGRLLLRVQPWLFWHRVVDLWQENLHLLEESNSFPWADIAPLRALLGHGE